MAGPRLIDRFAAAVAHLFYRVDVAGSPPLDGPLLILPNHFNALLDPALIMATAGRPVLFLAKSTLFHGPFSPLLAAAGAIPVYRRQDGVATGRNNETFAAVHAALSRGDAVCIFPEGISHSSGRLEELRTGASRMALSAAAAGIDVRMVAAGINLERKTTFRSRATVAYGTPFARVAHAAASSDAVRAQTARIADHMRALLVEAAPDGDAQLVERLNQLYVAGRTTDTDLTDDLQRRKTIAEGIRRVRAERPEFYEAAIIQLRRYDDRLRRFRLTDVALDWDLSHKSAFDFIAREAPLAIVLVPIAALAIAVFAVPYALTALASKMTAETDVTATAKVVAGAIIYTAWCGLLTVAAWWMAGLPFAVLVALVLPILAVAGLFTIEREASVWQTSLSWLASRGTRHTTRAGLRRRRAELADVLDDLHVDLFQSRT